MFSDPQFWVAVSFFLFLIAIFNPVKKILTSNLDTQINEIKFKIHEAEDLKKEAEKTLTDLKNRQSDVEKEIQALLALEFPIQKHGRAHVLALLQSLERAFYGYHMLASSHFS